MRQKRRAVQDSDRHIPSAVATQGGAATADVRVAAERFLSAADEAIERALSGDSEAFLAASRQTSAQ